MKQRITNLFLFAFMVILLSSCGSDDDCTTEDYAGTWQLNSEDCTSEDASASQTLTITAIDANTISVDDGGTTGAFNVTVVGCSFEESINFESIFGPIQADYKGDLNGNTLELDVATTIIGLTIDCKASYTK